MREIRPSQQGAALTLYQGMKRCFLSDISLQGHFAVRLSGPRAHHPLHPALVPLWGAGSVLPCPLESGASSSDVLEDLASPCFLRSMLHLSETTIVSPAHLHMQGLCPGEGGEEGRELEPLLRKPTAAQLLSRPLYFSFSPTEEISLSFSPFLLPSFLPPPFLLLFFFKFRE